MTQSLALDFTCWEIQPFNCLAVTCMFAVGLPDQLHRVASHMQLQVRNEWLFQSRHLRQLRSGSKLGVASPPFKRIRAGIVSQSSSLWDIDVLRTTILASARSQTPCNTSPGPSYTTNSAASSSKSDMAPPANIVFQLETNPDGE